MKGWSLGRRCALLMAVVLLDGALFGATAGVMNGAGSGAAVWGPGVAVQGLGAAVQESGAAIAADSGGRTVQELRTVALTFDDGPHAEYTARLLDGLKERGVKVTFFLLGQNIEGNEELVQRMQQEGHLIGNHSFRHVQLTKVGEEAVCGAIEQNAQLIEQITGVRPGYIRPPYGDWNSSLECRLDEEAVFWTVDSLDWKLQDAAAIVKRVKQRMEDGSIILMHDVFDTSVDAALELIDTMTQEGYRFVTVDELLVD